MTSRSNRLLGQETRPCVQSESHSYSTIAVELAFSIGPHKTMQYNTVRQGGILFLLLSNVYINDLSMRLSQIGIGGSISGKIVNNMMYAEDVCIISLSSAGLQSLLNICTEYC